jgi:hypothetical protein
LRGSGSGCVKYQKEEWFCQLEIVSYLLTGTRTQINLHFHLKFDAT